MRKRRQIHLGDPVYYDDKGQMFVNAGSARVYLNRATVTKIEARKKKDGKQRKSEAR